MRVLFDFFINIARWACLIICKFYFEQLHSNSVAKKLSDNFVGVYLLRVFLLTFRERGIYLVLK